jgi:hypothetical protein
MDTGNQEKQWIQRQSQQFSTEDGKGIEVFDITQKTRVAKSWS